MQERKGRVVDKRLKAILLNGPSRAKWPGTGKSKNNGKLKKKGVSGEEKETQTNWPNFRENGVLKKEEHGTAQLNRYKQKSNAIG